MYRDSLPADIAAVLQASDWAEDVPVAEVREIAAGITRKRAETDLRVDLARRIGGDGRPAVIRARFESGPNFVKIQHEKAFEADLAEEMPRLQSEELRPTGTETRVARAVVATRGTEDHELALAMANALGFGTTATAGRSGGGTWVPRLISEGRDPTSRPAETEPGARSGDI